MGPHEWSRAARVGLPVALLLLAPSLAACGGDDGVISDGGANDAVADAGLAVTPPNIPWLAHGVPPIALAPCPPGWREAAVGGVTECDPYPEAGAAKCAFGEAHFPGEPGCRPIGEPCPAGDYATSLPTDGTVLYVSASAAPGGDGSLTAPYAMLSAVPWGSLAPSTTVALAKGTYEGTLPLRAGVEVVGACVAETIVTGVTAPVVTVITVTTAGEPAAVRNVAIVGAPQRGVSVESGRALSLDGVLVEGAHGLGVTAYGTATVIAARNIVVRGTRAAGREPGRGIDVEGGAHVAASHVLVEQNRETGVFGHGGGTEVELTDAVVRDTQSTADGAFGRGIDLQDGARLGAARVLVAQNRDAGVSGRGAGTALVLEDGVVRDTQSQANDGRGGRGIHLQEGARLAAARVLVAQNRDFGVFLYGAGTEAVLEDGVVRDTHSRASDGAFGRGIGIEPGARLEAARVLVAHNRDTAVFVLGAGSESVLVDVAVLDTHGRESDLRYGYGVSAQQGARVSGERLWIDTPRELGLLAVGDDASVELTDVSITNVERSECGCERVYGYAVAAVGASVRLTGFRVRAAGTCGLFVGPDPDLPGIPSLDVASGVVEQAEIGACVQVDGYDFMRLTRDVVYLDNGNNLDTTMLPVPTPADPLGP